MRCLTSRCPHTFWHVVFVDVFVRNNYVLPLTEWSWKLNIAQLNPLYPTVIYNRPREPGVGSGHIMFHTHTSTTPSPTIPVLGEGGWNLNGRYEQEIRTRCGCKTRGNREPFSLKHGAALAPPTVPLLYWSTVGIHNNALGRLLTVKLNRIQPYMPWIP
jgi:hypothetical protein